jgi:hypothetical protein
MFRLQPGFALLKAVLLRKNRSSQSSDTPTHPHQKPRLSCHTQRPSGPHTVILGFLSHTCALMHTNLHLLKHFTLPTTTTYTHVSTTWLCNCTPQRLTSIPYTCPAPRNNPSRINNFRSENQVPKRFILGPSESLRLVFYQTSGTEMAFFFTFSFIIKQMLLHLLQESGGRSIHNEAGKT